MSKAESDGGRSPLRHVLEGIIVTNYVTTSGSAYTLSLGPGDTFSVMYDGGSYSSVLLGAVETVFSGGVSWFDTILSGSMLEIESGAIAYLPSILSGGELIVDSGGIGLSGIISDRGAEIVYGKAGSDSVFGGGNISAMGGGETGDSQISSGGVEYVLSGGVASATVVFSGGVERISAGGTASAATVSAGGKLIVAGAGRAHQTTVLAGGELVLDGAGVWSGTGTARLGGILLGKGDLIEDGTGTLIVSAHAQSFTGDAIISGGVVELAEAAGLSFGTVNFADNTTKKTLEIAAVDRPAQGETFDTTLVDFDSSSATYVDLVGLAYTSGATAALTGHKLTLHDGTYTAGFTLSGTGASKYAVLSDGAGGTEIRAAIGATKAPTLVHAMAAFKADHGIAGSTSAHGVGLTSAATEMLKPR